MGFSDNHGQFRRDSVFILVWHVCGTTASKSPAQNASRTCRKAL